MSVASARPPRSPVTPAPPHRGVLRRGGAPPAFPRWRSPTQFLPPRHGHRPSPPLHPRQGLLPAETIRRQKSQRSHALLETPPVRHRVPTADRRRGQPQGGPGRTLGGGSIVSRGQLIPRTPALQTSHFPSPPPNPTTRQKPTT